MERFGRIASKVGSQPALNRCKKLPGISNNKVTLQGNFPFFLKANHLRRNFGSLYMQIRKFCNRTGNNHTFKNTTILEKSKSEPGRKKPGKAIWNALKRFAPVFFLAENS